jgi:drug/metabolite transporter (DMT)-like permease
MTSPRISSAAWAALGLLALIWGSSFLSVAVALREVAPLTLVFWRVALAAAILWAAALARGTAPKADRDSLVAFAVMGLLANAVPFALLAWGQMRIETGLAAILNASTAIYAAVAAALLLPDEKLTPRRALGVALGFAGVVAMIGLEALGGFDLRSAAQAAVAGSGVFYALSSVWAKLRLKGLPPETAAAGMLTAAALWLAPAMLLVDGVPTRAPSAPTLLAMGWLAAACTAGAYLLYYRVLAMAGAANALLVTLMIPPVSIALGAVALGERIGPEALVGYGLLALGLAVIDGRAVGAVGGVVTRLRGGARGA